MTIQNYLNTIEITEQRARMREILEWVEKYYPELEGVVKWNQPMYIHNGTFIIGFSIAKHHLSFTPEEYVIGVFSTDITKAGYEHTKGLGKIKWTDEVDYNLLRKLIEFNIEEKKSCKSFFRK